MTRNETRSPTEQRITKLVLLFCCLIENCKNMRMLSLLPQSDFFYIHLLINDFMGCLALTITSGFLQCLANSWGRDTMTR